MTYPRGGNGKRYEEDYLVRHFVREHPDGGSQVEIAELLGVSKMRVCQIESEALAKYAARMSAGSAIDGTYG